MGYCNGNEPIYFRVTMPNHNPSQPQPPEDVGTIPDLNLYEVKKVEAVFSQLTFAQDMLRYLLPSDHSILLTTFLAPICLILMITCYMSYFRNVNAPILRMGHPLVIISASGSVLNHTVIPPTLLVYFPI